MWNALKQGSLPALRVRQPHHVPAVRQAAARILRRARREPARTRQGRGAHAPIPEMAALCVEQLAAFNDGTPLFLLGYSFGGFLAYEIARRLEEKGRPVAGVVLVASPPPGVIGGLRAIIDSSEDEIVRVSKEVYHYDFAEMTEAERRDYLNTLRWTRRRCLISLSGPP
ncbi:MAG: alpha/beta fold hydrolase [Bilophila wadsworthia]